MKKFWIILICVLIIEALMALLVPIYDNGPPRPITNTSSNIDSTAKEIVTRKKELVLKEYDSLFVVYDRETTIVYDLKGWSITLLALCITIPLTNKLVSPRLIFLVSLVIIFSFYILEVSERYAMLNLLQELRNLENIFEIKQISAFNTAIFDYQFRDIQDATQSLSLRTIAKAIFDARIVFWNLFLFALSFILFQNVHASKKSPQP